MTSKHNDISTRHRQKMHFV